MGDLYYKGQPGSSHDGSIPRGDVPTTLDSDDDWRPGRSWGGRMTVSVSQIVDWGEHDAVTTGDLVLVTESGLTRSAFVLELQGDDTVLVEVT